MDRFPAGFIYPCPLATSLSLVPGNSLYLDYSPQELPLLKNGAKTFALKKILKSVNFFMKHPEVYIIT